MARGRITIVCALFTALAAWVTPAHATYSIIAVDSSTKELVYGAATCLGSADLIIFLPAPRVGKGIGVAQGFGDLDGVRRPVMLAGFDAGVAPQDILTQLEPFPAHEGMQYAILDTQGRSAVFTGPLLEAWAGDRVGSIGTITYSIQGNVLAGACVLPAIEAAFLGASGDLPARLLAAMQAGRDAGGDGRCSCSLIDPTSCGCPPGPFFKSAHTGAMLVSRPGDTDDPVCNGSGCADGDYFMVFNIASQGIGNPDPVTLMEPLYAAWRASLVGRPDGVQSVVSFEPAFMPADGVSTTMMRIELRDWAGNPATGPLIGVDVVHAPDSDVLSSIGSITNLGGGVVEVELTAGVDSGADRFDITIEDGGRPVRLAPAPVFEYQLGDVDGNGAVGFCDLLLVLSAWGPCPPPEDRNCAADLDENGTVEIADLLQVLAGWNGGGGC